MKLSRPTSLVAEMVPAAMSLFNKNYRWNKPIRSIGIRGADLVPENAVYQLSLYDDEYKREKLERLERTVDRIRGQFGFYSLQRAILISDRMKSVNANNDNGDEKIFYNY
jgi:DNA polymerase-4